MELNRNSVTLLSIYPGDNLVQSMRHVGLVQYKMPGCKKDKILVRRYNPEVISNLGKIPENAPQYTDTVDSCEEGNGYVLMRVFETFAITRDWTQDKEVQVPHPISARILADDLRAMWATSGYLMSGEVGPGIILIAGETPTAEELERVTTNQRLYFERLVQDAIGLEAQGNRKNITESHRMAARWFGMDEEWIPRMTERKMKTCRACSEKIMAKALKCKHCNADLVDFYRKHNITPDALEDAAVAAILTQPKTKAA